jgi:hypothetical protein
MDCQRIHNLIDEALFSGEELPQQAQAHLKQCLACRQYFQQGDNLLGIVDTMRVVPADHHFMAGLASRVIKRAEAGEKLETKLLPMRILFNPRTMLVAASVVGVIFVGLVGYYLMPILLSKSTQWEKTPQMELQPTEGFTSPQYSLLTPTKPEKPTSSTSTTEQMPTVSPKPLKEPADMEMTREKELVYGSVPGEGGVSRSTVSSAITGTTGDGATSEMLGGYSPSPGGDVFAERMESSTVSVEDKASEEKASIVDMLSAPGPTTSEIEGFKREEAQPKETPILPTESGDIASLYLAKDPSVPIMTEMSTASLLPLVVDKMKQDSGFPYTVSSKSGSDDHSSATFASSITSEDAAYLEDVILNQISSAKNGSSVYMLINNLSSDEKTKIFDCLVK